MTIMQQLKDQFGQKKIEDNTEFTPEQISTVRKFLRDLPKKYSEEEVQEREIYVEVAEKFGNNKSSK